MSASSRSRAAHSWQGAAGPEEEGELPRGTPRGDEPQAEGLGYSLAGRIDLNTDFVSFFKVYFLIKVIFT